MVVSAISPMGVSIAVIGFLFSQCDAQHTTKVCRTPNGKNGVCILFAECSAITSDEARLGDSAFNKIYGGCESESQGVVVVCCPLPDDKGQDVECRALFEDFMEKICNIKAKLPSKTGANCAELLDKGMTGSGIYNITPEGFPDGVNVYCDQETDGGGWTVFLQRSRNTVYPPVDFARTFEEYATGFGDLTTEFWIGNRILHSLTSDGPFTLRVEAKRIGHDDVRFGLWDTFSVGSEDTKFTLSLGGYSTESTLGEALVTLSEPHHNANGRGFSTFDQDNDGHSTSHCSVSTFGKAGWWFSSCGHTSPTGPFGGDTLSWDKPYWYYWEPTTAGSASLISEIQFKIRPPLLQ